MATEYEQDSENQYSEQQSPQKARRQTKNQQIYGDFYQAHEVQPQKPVYTRTDAYQKFKAGATIDTYSSQVEVDLPKSKPKFARTTQESQEDDAPMLGKFSLNSFLNQLDRNQLQPIDQSENEYSSLDKPQGLNQLICAHLQLVKTSENVDEPSLNIEDLNFSQYMRQVKNLKSTAQVKYKTAQEKQLAKQFQDGYGVGFKMMQKMGFNVTKGLGKQLSGIHRPVEAIFKTAFTMKDEPQKSKNRSEEQNSEQSEPSQEQTSMAQKLFQFSSRTPHINNFLLQVKRSYEKLQSQIYFYTQEIESFEKQEELTVSLKYQKQNEIAQLSNQIMKLEQVKLNIYDCQLYPHLGSYYKVDILYVKQLYQKLSGQGFQWMYLNAQNQLRQLISLLSKFYISKTKQTVREYHKFTTIQQKIYKNHPIQKKTQKQIIDLEKEPTQQQSDLITLTPEDQEKISQFIDLIISRTIIPQVQKLLSQFDSIDKIKDLRVIELIEVVKRFDKKGQLMKRMISDILEPLCSRYMQTINLQDLQLEGVKKLPHMILFPWFTIIRPAELHLMNFFHRLASKAWSIESSNLYNVISPLIRFSSKKEINFFTNLYLAPRLLHELQKFNISQANVSLLNGFIRYCQFLGPQTKHDILLNTISVQITSTYKKYKQEISEHQLQKWLSRWRKFTDRILLGFFDRQFND